jgi:hypothetical protein
MSTYKELNEARERYIAAIADLKMAFHRKQAADIGCVDSPEHGFKTANIYILTEEQRRDLVSWARSDSNRCLKALENL